MKAGQCYRSQYSKVDVEENRFRKLQTVSVVVAVNWQLLKRSGVVGRLGCWPGGSSRAFSIAIHNDRYPHSSISRHPGDSDEVVQMF